MKLLLASHIDQLLAQGRATAAALKAGADQPDYWPVVKLFTPDAACTWLLYKLDPGRYGGHLPASEADRPAPHR